MATTLCGNGTVTKCFILVTMGIIHDILTDRSYPSVNSMVISLCSPVRFNPDQKWLSFSAC